MKTIVAGSRKGISFDDVCDTVELCPWEITSVVSGAAKGVDKYGEEIANYLGLPIHQFPITKEDWNTYGKGAGHIRNKRMAENAEALIAVWDGKSSGTKDMIDQARKNQLKVFVVIVKENSLDLFD